MNRVVITGLGVVSPVGLNSSDFWSALLNGVCGIAPITSFDASGLKVRLAAELKGFDPTAFGMDKNMARKMDPFVQYAMAAAREAVEDSGLVAGQNIEGERRRSSTKRARVLSVGRKKYRRILSR